MLDKNMLEVRLPYGRGSIVCSLPKQRVQGVLTSEVNRIHPDRAEQEIIRCALEKPIGTRRLSAGT